MSAMTETAPILAKIWRGDFLESVHRGHAVIVNGKGEVIEGWGDPSKIILPRSSCKMLQALPLVESGAAKNFGLRSEQLALACASHQAAALHTKLVVNWLSILGKGDADLRCGPQDPSDPKAHADLLKRGYLPCQYHNNCSGKHAGMLTLNAHLKTGVPLRISLPLSRVWPQPWRIWRRPSPANAAKPRKSWLKL